MHFKFKKNIAHSRMLREEDMNHLPECVRAHLRKVNVINTAVIHTVRLKQKGVFNLNGKWIKLKAKQYFNAHDVEFMWKAKGGFLSVVDQFIHGKGKLFVKLLGIFKVASFEGDELDEGEALRFLSEMMWFPTSFVLPYLAWEELEDNKAKCVLRHKDVSVEGIFHFGTNDLIERFTAHRYREVNGQFEMTDWEAYNLEYATFNDILIPYKGSVKWITEDGDLPYYKMEITDVEYNVNAIY